MALFLPERHQPLVADPWDEERARAAIAAIAADAERSFDEFRLWPVHPDDDDDPDAGPLTTLYLGAAGVMWALDQLAARGLASARDWRPQLGRLAARYRTRPDGGTPEPSYLIGESGILAVAGDDDERLHQLIESNIANPTLEPLWGGAGTMMPALFRFRRTGDERWRALWLRNARHLLATWQYHPDAGCHLWTQQLYGEVVRLLGAGHGLAGNLMALLAGLDLLDPAEAATIVDRTRATLRATAIRADGQASWLPHVGTPRDGRDEILVQWCHGAPGMITSLAALPRDPDIDALLEAGGELTWQAGPLAKAPGLCHGTPGNGYAFLVLHARTGDPRWLERARRFAVHAIAQSRAARDRHGAGRHTLWTGDLGLAIYLADCIEARARFPTLDYL